MITTSIAAITNPFVLKLALRPARIIVALLLALALSACGFLQVAYNSSPELVYRWLDGYADFNDEQATRVRLEIERLHQWHRESELPRYAALLERLAQAASHDLTADAACRLVDESRERLDALLVAAEPLVVAVAIDFRPEQFRHLEGKFAKVNAKYARQWFDGTPAERTRRRLDRAVERAERFYGTLGDAQLAVIRAKLARSSFDPALTLAEAKRRQRDTVETLHRIGAAARTPAEVRAVVSEWMNRMQHSPDPAYRAYQRTIARKACESIAALHNSTTPAQRVEVARSLRGYAKDLRELGT